MTEDEIIQAIRDEMKAGGHPTATYLSLTADRRLNGNAAASITSAILVNLEDRIADLENRQ